mmetsp:Transcript_4623/g.9863  ORF Transcript_4623/g.9863 Transcript_4623/m.9863 type:complete len:253 (+) Transcript_4623:421-1179(+)
MDGRVRQAERGCLAATRTTTRTTARTTKATTRRRRHERLGLPRPPPPPLRHHLHRLPPLHRHRRSHPHDRPPPRLPQILLRPPSRPHVHPLRTRRRLHQPRRRPHGGQVGDTLHAHRRPVSPALELRIVVRLAGRLERRDGHRLRHRRADVRGDRQGFDQVGGEDGHQVGHSGGEGYPLVSVGQSVDGLEELLEGRGVFPRIGLAGSVLRVGLGVHDGVDRAGLALCDLGIGCRIGDGQEEEQLLQGDFRLG